MSPTWMTPGTAGWLRRARCHISWHHDGLFAGPASVVCSFGRVPLSSAHAWKGVLIMWCTNFGRFNILIFPIGKTQIVCFTSFADVFGPDEWNGEQDANWSRSDRVFLGQAIYQYVSKTKLPLLLRLKREFWADDGAILLTQITRTGE